MATVERVLTGPRWSAAVRCPRACVYGAQDAPRREWTPTELRRFRRGKVWEAAVKADVIEGFDGKEVIQEAEVAWPTPSQEEGGQEAIGVGHADLFIVSDRHIVEIVSNAGGHLPAEKALQAAGYAVYHPDADSASVIAVDTHTGDDHVYPVDVAGLEPQVRAITEQVAQGCLGGDAPPRVCKTPLDGPAQTCRYAEHCFADWTWPKRDELIADGLLVAELADTIEQRKGFEAEAKKRRAHEDELKAELALLVPTGVEATVTYGGESYSVKHTERQSGDRFRLADLVKTGHTLPPDLAMFVSPSKTSSVITVRRESR